MAGVQTTTTRFLGKPFNFTYSKLKNFEACPKKHWHYDIARDIKEEESEQLTWGNEVHKAMAERVGNGVELPKAFKSYEPWAAKILATPGKIMVEQKLAITEDLSACGWMSPIVWMRAIADVIKIAGPVALAADYKTGKIKEDLPQLGLVAACVFAAYPEIQAVRSEFIWLAEGCTTSGVWKRADMPAFWNGLSSRIATLKHAHDTTTYPAKPGGLCRKWCGVTSCPHQGV